MPYRSNGVHGKCNSEVSFRGLLLLAEGPRTFRECSEGTQTVCKCPVRPVPTTPNSSELAVASHSSFGLASTGRNLSQPVLVATAVALKTFMPTASRLQSSCLQVVSFRPEGRRDGQQIHLTWHARPLKWSADSLRPSCGTKCAAGGIRHLDSSA